LTLGRVSHDVRDLEDRVTALEIGEKHWKGDERRSDADTAFSDEQVERIKAIFDERAEVHAGRAFFRLVLWTLGAASAGAATVFFAYLKIKG
jgi:hypothetical protein